MLFTKVGVYKAEADGAFIVELGHEAEDQAQPIHTSRPLASDEVTYLLRHVELTDKQIEDHLIHASDFRNHIRSSSKASAAAR